MRRHLTHVIRTLTPILALSAPGEHARTRTQLFLHYRTSHRRTSNLEPRSIAAVELPDFRQPTSPSAASDIRYPYDLQPLTAYDKEAHGLPLVSSVHSLQEGVMAIRSLSTVADRALGLVGVCLLLLVAALAEIGYAPHESLTGRLGGCLSRRAIDGIAVVGWLVDRTSASHAFASRPAHA
jgi:hypothetical protein